MLVLWGMRSTLLLQSLPGPVWPEVGAPDRVLSIGQIELNEIELFWHLTVGKQKLRLYLTK